MKDEKEIELSEAESHKLALQIFERNLLHAALVRHGFNYSKTALALEIDRKTLYNKIDKLKHLKP